MKKYILALFIVTGIMQVNAQSNVDAKRERLISHLDSIAKANAESNPSVSMVIYSLITTMHIRKDDVLAERVMKITGELLKPKTENN